MLLMEALKERRSVRVFADRQVSRQDVERVLAAAIAAPSKGNCQIWEFVAVNGRKKKAVDEMLFDLLKTDLIPAMSVGESDSPIHSEAYQKAQRRSRQNREDITRLLAPTGRSFDTFMLEGTFTFFNAPVAILVFVDEVFSKDLPHILSVGAAVQNILLAATDMGLGTCWIGGVWRYTKEIRTLLEIPQSKKLLSAVAIGYPDADSSISRYKSSRDDIGEFVRWVGFDDEQGEK